MPKQGHRQVSMAMRVLLCALVWPSTGAAQDDASTVVVGYTIARNNTQSAKVKLPGTVQSRHRSIIGSETEGIVVALHVREGDAVTAGTSLAQLRTDVLRQRLSGARAGLEATKAKQELTRRSLERAQQLFRKNSMSQQQLDELAYELLDLQATEKRQEAEIAEIELSIEHSDIRAPFDGVIIARHTDIGEWRELGDPIVELISISELEVEVAVPAIYFNDLSATKTAEVVFNSGSQQRLVLELSALVPVAEPGSRSFRIKLRVPADLPGPRLAVGMLADVSLALGQASAATIVPKDAIVQRQEERLVVLLDDRNQVRMVKVDTGRSFGAWIEVRGNVASGDRVVVRGNERLEAGQTVTPTLLEY